MSLSLWVCVSVVILFSLEYSKHLKQYVLRVAQVYLFEVSWVFQESLKDVSRKF